MEFTIEVVALKLYRIFSSKLFSMCHVITLVWQLFRPSLRLMSSELSRSTKDLKQGLQMNAWYDKIQQSPKALNSPQLFTKHLLYARLSRYIQAIKTVTMISVNNLVL